MSPSEQIGYECFDALIQQLRVEGHVETATKLHSLLHETAWTTGSELIGELGLAIRAFEQKNSVVGSDLRRCLDDCIRFVRQSGLNTLFGPVGIFKMPIKINWKFLLSNPFKK